MSLRRRMMMAPKVYVYKNGEYADWCGEFIVGGYTRWGEMLYTNNGAIRLSNNGRSTGTIGTRSPLNLSGYKKLFVRLETNFSATSYAGIFVFSLSKYFQAGSTETNSFGDRELGEYLDKHFDAPNDNHVSGVYELDIQEFPYIESCYICLCLDFWAVASATVTVHEIWLE